MCLPSPPSPGGGVVQAPREPWGQHSPPPSPEEIEKKLNIYHKGAKIWKMLIFCQVGPHASLLGSGGWGGASRGCHLPASVCVRGAVDGHLVCAAPQADHHLLQGGPGHLYLLKNKVATFAKVEKEEDMIQ